MINRTSTSPRRATIVATVALIAAGAASVGLAAQARPDEPTEHLMLFASPTEATERAAKPGDVQDLAQVPFAITSHDGSRYRLAIDPRRVPAANVGKGGLVNFEVERYTDNGSVGRTGFSLRRNPGHGTEWIDANNPTTTGSADGYRTVSVDLPVTRVTDREFDGMRRNLQPEGRA